MIALYLIASLLFVTAIVSWAQSYLGAGTKSEGNVKWEPADGLHVVIRYGKGVVRKFKTAIPHKVSTAYTAVYIPAGFEFDGASIPFLLRPVIHVLDPWARFEPAAAVHDLLYRIQKASRYQADAFFRELMLDAGVPHIPRVILYRSVRIFGGEAWRQNAVEAANRSGLVAQQKNLERYFDKFGTETIA